MSEDFITEYKSPLNILPAGLERKWHKALFGRITDNPLSNLFIDLFIIGRTLEFVEDPKKIKSQGIPVRVLQSHEVLELKEFKEKLELKLGKHINACFQSGDIKKVRSLEAITKTVNEKLDAVYNGDLSNDIIALNFVENCALVEKMITRYNLREHFESEGRVLSDDQFYGVIKRLNIGHYFCD